MTDFLNLMQIKKNACDSVIGTLVNISRKTKDKVKSRLDSLKIGIKSELNSKKKGQWTFVPPTSHTLSRK